MVQAMAFSLFPLAALAVILQAASVHSVLYDVFKSGKSNCSWSLGQSVCYRIPAMVRIKSSTTADDTLLAFASERLTPHGGCSDSSDTNLVLRRSIDGGSSWESTQLVVPTNPTNASGMSMSSAPWALVDDTTSAVFLFYSGHSTETERCDCKVYYVKSSDKGQSWSEPVITNLVGSSLTSGITIQNGPYKSRIITCMRKICKNSCTAPYYSFAAYSDDHGSTWTASRSLAEGTTECQIAELSNGSLYMSSRPYHFAAGMDYRLASFSSDGGASWSDAQQVNDLVAAGGVAGSVISDPHSKNIFFSHPDAGGRTNMTVYLSTDNAVTWNPKYDVYPGGSAYSSMSFVDNSSCSVGLLFEKDNYESISFEVINGCGEESSDAIIKQTRVNTQSESNWSSIYEVKGSIEVDTNENTMFWWKDALFVLENIPCYYSKHACSWNSTYCNNSYARIRRWDNGEIVVNISSTIGYGFVSAFTDDYPAIDAASDPVLWLFGSECNRCPHEPRTTQGCTPNRNVQTWWSTDMLEWGTDTITELPSTFNVQVSRVTNVSKVLSGIDVSYVMMLEPFIFALHNKSANLTSGWVVVDSKTPKVPSGGPSIRYNPKDDNFYILTGGHIVDLVRTKDFNSWEYSPNAPFIKSTASDANVAPYAGFPAIASARDFGPMHDDWTKWDWNSNDADICCMTPNAPTNMSFVIWGAGTQGATPKPPLTIANHCTNAVGIANMSLADLLIAHFEK